MSNAFGLPDHLGHEGSCIVCLTGTDTGLGFRGCSDWVKGGLAVLGVPVDQATATIDSMDLPPDELGRAEATFRVCASCSAKAGMPDPVLLLAGASVLTLEQRGGDPR